MGIDAGIMISASHNPFEDNGIKIFSRHGFKLPDAKEDEIELLATSQERLEPLPTGSALGTILRVEDAPQRYTAFCKNTFPGDLNLAGMKVVLDCANGTTYRVAPAVFIELGADVTAIHCGPDGININDRCVSQHTEDLKDRGWLKNNLVVSTIMSNFVFNSHWRNWASNIRRHPSATVMSLK